MPQAKLTWSENIAPDLTGEMKKLFAKLGEARRAVREGPQAAFETAMTKYLEETDQVPPGHEVRFGYNFGGLVIAFQASTTAKKTRGPAITLKARGKHS